MSSSYDALDFQDEARVVFWCLSRQELHPDMVQQHCQALVSAIALGLVTSNKWESMQCVHHSLKSIARLSQQIPEALREAAHLWLPQLWRLLLVQPVTQYEQASAWLTAVGHVASACACCSRCGNDGKANVQPHTHASPKHSAQRLIWSQTRHHQGADTNSQQPEAPCLL